MCAYIHVIKGQNVSCKKFSNSVKHILAMKKKLKKKKIPGCFTGHGLCIEFLEFSSFSNSRSRADAEH